MRFTLLHALGRGLLLLACSLPGFLGAQTLRSPDDVGRRHNQHLAAMQRGAAHLPDADALAWLAQHLRIANQQSAAQTLARSYAQHSARQEQLGLTNTLAMLRTTQADAALTQMLFALPDTLGDATWQQRVTTLREQAEAAPATYPVSRQVLAVAEHSTRYWVAVLDSEDVNPGLPRGRDLSDSARRIKRRRIAKADAGGLLKGLTFGIVQYGVGVWFLNVPSHESAALGGVTALLFTVFDSFSYGRKLRNGQVKLADDPWWGPPQPADSTKGFVVPEDDSYRRQ